MDYSSHPESSKKKVTLNRTISFDNDLSSPGASAASAKHQTATPSLLSRLKSFKEDKGNTKRKSRANSDSDQDSGSPIPLDDMIFLESFEDVHYNEELSTTVCKDMIRQSLLDMMKSGNPQLLHDIEAGKIRSENVENSFERTTRYEKNIAFLWSVFYKKRELLDYFLRKADLNFSENQQGFTALHLSSFTGCGQCTSTLISHGANVNVKSNHYTPLHCAAFGNSPQAAKLLLNAGAKTRTEETGCSETVIHTAVRANAVECLQLLIDENLDVNSMGTGDSSPLHLAADLGNSRCLQVLLTSDRCDVNLLTLDRKNSALHLAAENGFVECVKLLLEKGADVNSKNYRQQTPLHFAAKACLECVEELLDRGSDPNSPDSDNRTPLHAAVCKSELEFGLEITKCLITNRSDVNKKDKYGYTPLHIAALNELSDCVECLILNGGDVSARTRGGASALSIISRKTPSALSAISQVLDDCITMNDPDASSKDVILKFNFRYLLQNCERGEIQFLQTFVEDGQKNILEHPLCEAFLYLKWQKIRKYYIARLIFGFIYVLLLSVYVLTALAYQCYNDSQNGDDIASRIIIVEPELCPTKSYVTNILRHNPFIIEVEWFLLAFMTILEICRKIYGFSGYASFRHYVRQTDNIVEWFVVVSVFLISFIYTGRTYVWQNHVGALAVLCGWANLMIMIGHLPIFGSYVTMYTKVQKEFTKLLLAYICLLIGFTVCFCVIFPKTKQFSNPFLGIIKILVMMTGELEFDDLIENITQEESHKVLLLEISALTTFVLFLLFVTIILMNLLIGIAVHDIQGLKKTAGLSKLVGQTKLISRIESALFHGCLPVYFFKLLQLTALISPSSYRVVVCVKPLDPRESRLPTEVMRKALEIAKQKRIKPPPSSKNSIKRRMTLIRKKNAEDLDHDVGAILIKLTEEIEKLKEIIMNNQNVINNLSERSTKR